MNKQNGKSHLRYERKRIVPEMGKIVFEMNNFFWDK